MDRLPASSATARMLLGARHQVRALVVASSLPLARSPPLTSSTCIAAPACSTVSVVRGLALDDARARPAPDGRTPRAAVQASFMEHQEAAAPVAPGMVLRCLAPGTASPRVIAVKPRPAAGVRSPATASRRTLPFCRRLPRALHRRPDHGLRICCLSQQPPAFCLTCAKRILCRLCSGSQCAAALDSAEPASPRLAVPRASRLRGVAALGPRSTPGHQLRYRRRRCRSRKFLAALATPPWAALGRGHGVHADQRPLAVGLG